MKVKEDVKISLSDDFAGIIETCDGVAIPRYTRLSRIKNGKLHREDGPAMEFANGEKRWYLNWKLHRENGPAIEWIDGSKYWYLNGIHYSEQDWKREVEKPKKKKLILK
jgi:hypothetical protein